jgi:hypothetical protein
MFRKLRTVLVLPCALSFAAAAPVSLGTVAARGNIWVDNYKVMSNATLFDGTVVRTEGATANLRLDNGARVTMAPDSRGALHRDRLVLQLGKIESVVPTSFQIEASGLHITPSQANSRAVVSIKAENSVEVAALAGGFSVTNDQGVLLATLRTGQAVSFAVQAGDSSACMGTGTIGSEGGDYFITIASTGIKYELTAPNLAKLMKDLVGQSVAVKGSIVSGATPAGGAAAVIAVENFWTPAPGAYSGQTLLISGRLIVGGAAGPVTGVSATYQTMDPAGIP